MRMPTVLVLNAAVLLALALVLALPGAALAQGWRHDVEPVYDWADVVRVEPLVRMVEQPSYQQQCWDEPVVHHEPDRYVRHDRPRAPVVVGGIIGGVIGNQFGHGRGRHAATAAGAMLGYEMVRDSQGGHYVPGRSYTRYERRCEPQAHYQQYEQVTGYEVTYRYHGRLYQTVTEHPPGPQLQVRVDVSPAH